VLCRVGERVEDDLSRGCDVDRQLPNRPPGPVLVWIADRPDDLLVVGCGGWGRLGYVVHGAVSRYCLAHARCPVLAVPAPEMIRELRTRHHWRPEDFAAPRT